MGGSKKIIQITHGKDKKPNSKFSWGKMKYFVEDVEWREVLGDRAYNLLALKQRFLGLPQDILDINKIQYKFLNMEVIYVGEFIEFVNLT